MTEDPGPGQGPWRVLLVMGTTDGGVGRHVRSLAASLSQAGHQVLVAGPGAGERALDITGAGARFVAVETGDRPHPRQDARAVRELSRLSRGVDVVHAHGLRTGGLAVLARRRTQVPLAVTLHNALLAHGLRGGLVAGPYAVLERMVARRADVVLGVSPDLEDRLRRLGARDVRHAVVPAPATTAPRRTPEQVRETLGAGDRPLVVSIARLAEQKGLPLLLDATALLAAPGRPLVVVAGDGPLRGRLQARIDVEELPVRLLGWRDDVPDLLAAADVVVSSAVWEGQPIAVQQALAVGAAVVATDVGGTAAVTGGAAVLVPSGDARGLAEQIDRLLTDEQARAHLAARARIRAAQLPTEADACAAALALYGDLVRGRRRT